MGNLCVAEAPSRKTRGTESLYSTTRTSRTLVGCKIFTFKWVPQAQSKDSCQSHLFSFRGEDVNVSPKYCFHIHNYLSGVAMSSLPTSLLGHEIFIKWPEWNGVENTFPINLMLLRCLGFRIQSKVLMAY